MSLFHGFFVNHLQNLVVLSPESTGIPPVEFGRWISTGGNWQVEIRNLAGGIPPVKIGRWNWAGGIPPVEISRWNLAGGIWQVVFSWLLLSHL